jgi:branched-chain amino acid transport system substrate-binding protein
VDRLKAKKIGYINHDDAYGTWNLTAAEFQAKQHSGTTLSVQSISPNINDVTAPMLKVRAANPDVLLLTTYARPAALIIKKAHELGWTKPIVLAVNGTADLKQLVENVGGPSALKNFYIQDVVAGLPDDPKLKWVYDMYKQYYPELAAKPGYPQSYMPYGIPSAMTVVQALKDAGPQPTREKVLAALEHLKLDTGIMAGPIEFTPTDHAAQKAAIYMKFDGTNKDLIPGAFKSDWTYTGK